MEEFWTNDEPSASNKNLKTFCCTTYRKATLSLLYCFSEQLYQLFMLFLFKIIVIVLVLVALGISPKNNTSPFLLYMLLLLVLLSVIFTIFSFTFTGIFLFLLCSLWHWVIWIKSWGIWENPNEDKQLKRHIS